MFKKALDSVKEYNMLSKGDSVVVGLSGGADSVALLCFLNSVKESYDLTLTAVHINHSLRGAEADADERFAKEISQRLGVCFMAFCCDVKGASESMGISVEEAGRFIRYKKFKEVLNEMAANKIAVAHNMNDQVETLIMRLCRGTGLKGLGGIPPVRGNIIRPLIRCSRAEIEAYLKEIGQAYRDDATNFDDVYTRNKIRLKVLPLFSNEINERALENIAKTAELLRCDEEYLNSLALSAFESAAVNKNSGEITLSLNVLKELEDAVLFRVLRLAFEAFAGTAKDFELRHLKALKELILKGTGKSVSLPWGIGCRTVYDTIELYKTSEEEALPYEYELPVNGEIFIKEAGIYVGSYLNCKKNGIKSFNICTKAFDYDKIKNGLKVRSRISGDKIVLKGLNGAKSVKDFFIDEKIPRDKRNLIPLVAFGQNVIWIINRRVSQYYLASKDSKNILYVYFREDILNEGEDCTFNNQFGNKQKA
ncbi:MAG: tRNA lysidine(34) synthetase TilS [Lachnospiraceae bacterium]|nr:tRNA lysidine(34) synthetase TilS [Lachnospiraceae bacterium]